MARGDVDPMESYTGEDIPEEQRTLGVSGASPGPNTFDGAGGFSYRFDPATETYTIVAAPPEYKHLVGVTVQPGSHAYASIQAEHQTGESLYESPEEAADTPRGGESPIEGETVDYGLAPGESEQFVEDFSPIPGESNPDQPEGLEHEPYQMDPYFPGGSRLRTERAAKLALQKERFDRARAEKKAEEEAAEAEAYRESDEAALRSAAAATGREFTGVPTRDPWIRLKSGPYRR